MRRYRANMFYIWFTYGLWGAGVVFFGISSLAQLTMAIVAALLALGVYAEMYWSVFEVAVTSDGLIRCSNYLRRMEFASGSVKAVRFREFQGIVTIEHEGGRVYVNHALFGPFGLANSFPTCLPYIGWPPTNYEGFIEFVTWLRSRNPAVRIEGMDRLEELTRPQ